VRERGVSLRLTAETTFPNMAAAAAAFGVKQEIEYFFCFLCVQKEKQRRRDGCVHRAAPEAAVTRGRELKKEAIWFNSVCK